MRGMKTGVRAPEKADLAAPAYEHGAARPLHALARDDLLGLRPVPPN